MAGNQLAVVHDADGLDDAAMLAFARETKLSETTFVQSGGADADYRNRIWMLTGELPMAGHPSLGTAVAVAHRRGATHAEYVQRTPAGLQPVTVELSDRVARASMLQEPAEFLGEPDHLAVLEAIGLEPSDLAPDLRPEVVATGVPQVLVPMSGTDALARARPDAARVDAVLKATGAITIYAFVFEETAGTADARSFFASPGGIAEEDPATGSAAGPLMAYLHRHAGLAELTVTQGVQMGRPSRLDCALAGDRVRVGGEVVVLAQGVVHL